MSSAIEIVSLQQLWGHPDHVPPSVGVAEALLAQRALVTPPSLRSCPACGDPTSQPAGTCDCCTGDLRPVCRICYHPAPDADWSAAENAPHHYLQGRIVCAGSVLPVTILN